MTCQRLNIDMPKTEHDMPKTEHDMPKTEHDMPKTEHDMPKTEHDMPKTVAQVSTFSKLTNKETNKTATNTLPYMYTHVHVCHGVFKGSCV